MTGTVRTVFLGSGVFAVPVVAALSDHPQVDLITVVTAPTRPGSRGRPTDPPVADWASEHRVPMLRPVRLRAPESVAALAQSGPELLVLADYGQMVPGTVLDLPRHGALNLHPSLLPRHRGASPIAAAILTGDDETGVSLMLMDAGLDSGPIIAQRRFPLTGRETAPDLEAELAGVAAELLAASIGPWLGGKLVPRAQSDGGVTLTRPLRRSDGRLDPLKNAAELERQVRAYQPWPGSFVETDAGRLIVWQSTVGRQSYPLPTGALTTAYGGLSLVASDRFLDLVEVQPAGGRRMSGADLARGRPGLTGQLVR